MEHCNWIDARESLDGALICLTCGCVAEKDERVCPLTNADAYLLGRVRKLGIENDRLRRRLEISQDFVNEDANAKWRAQLVPPEEQDRPYDAVAARDEVIRILDTRVRESEVTLDTKLSAMRAAVARLQAGDVLGAERILCLAIGGEGDA